VKVLVMSQDKPLPSLTHASPSGDLLRQTLQTVAVLVAACVLFVGALSLLAVTVTSRAVSGAGADAPAKAAEVSAPDQGEKKPLSI
jgi:hypothetical protein